MTRRRCAVPATGRSRRRMPFSCHPQCAGFQQAAIRPALLRQAVCGQSLRRSARRPRPRPARRRRPDLPPLPLPSQDRRASYPGWPEAPRLARASLSGATGNSRPRDGHHQRRHQHCWRRRGTRQWLRAHCQGRQKPPRPFHRDRLRPHRPRQALPEASQASDADEYALRPGPAPCCGARTRPIATVRRRAWSGPGRASVRPA